MATFLYEMYFFFNLKNAIENRKFNFFLEYVKYEISVSMQNCQSSFIWLSSFRNLIKNFIIYALDTK